MLLYGRDTLMNKHLERRIEVLEIWLYTRERYLYFRPCYIEIKAIKYIGHKRLNESGGERGVGRK